MSSVIAAVSRGALGVHDIASAAQLACLLEASAAKPGNVSPGRHFANTRYEDFLASACAIGDAMRDGASEGVGQIVRAAIDATSRWTRSNTNLGIVLMFAPLAVAAQRPHPTGDEVAPDLLRRSVGDVLAHTTTGDANHVYMAIRRASPGGLGSAADQDVAHAPSLPLLDVMRLAADRDGIAREYATSFESTFTVGVPALQRARRDGLDWDDAVVETFLTLLAGQVDTHIVRRGGLARGEQASHHARSVLDRGGVRSSEGRAAVSEMDRALRDPANLSNPGTTADLTAAAIFALLLMGGWHDAAAGGTATRLQG